MSVNTTKMRLKLINITVDLYIKIVSYHIRFVNGFIQNVEELRKNFSLVRNYG